MLSMLCLFFACRHTPSPAVLQQLRRFCEKASNLQAQRKFH